MIRAEVHTDDFAYTAKFDATPFFKQATTEEVIELVQCEWGGDYPADEVARFHEGRDGFADVTEVFADAQRRKTGFECHVHYPDAMSWLALNRPEIFAKLDAGADADGNVFGAPKSDPYWDKDSSWAGDYQTDAAPVPGMR